MKLEKLDIRDLLEQQLEEDGRDEETEEEETEEEEEEEVGDLKKSRHVWWSFGEGEDPSLPAVNPRLLLWFQHSDQEPPRYRCLYLCF